jgi:hypothetical protein
MYGQCEGDIHCNWYYFLTIDSKGKLRDLRSRQAALSQDSNILHVVQSLLNVVSGTR